MSRASAIDLKSGLIPRCLVPTLFAAALLLASVASSPSSAEARSPSTVDRAQPKLTPVIESVLSTPRWYKGDDGRFHLEYELELTNTLLLPIEVSSVEVVDSDGRRRARFSGARLKAAMSLLGTPEVPTKTLPPSSVGIAWIDLSFPTKKAIPRRIKHRITVDLGSELPGVGQFIADTGAPALVARQDPTALAPPLPGGRWVTIVGPHRRAIYPVNGHLRLGQRFAVDFSARLDRQGRTHVGDPNLNSSYFNYRQPVLAVGAGVVVAAVDRLRDQVPNHKLPVSVSEADGNHVIIRLRDGVFAAYGHLAPGSVRVHRGQRVRAGQVIGRLGNSGNSGGPHLHFQLMGRPSFVDADGLPFVLDRFRLDGRVPSLEAFIDADADPAAPPVSYRRSKVPMRRLQGLTGLEVVSFGKRSQRSRESKRAGAGRGFTKLVKISDGRKLLLRCRGRGHPTVILISGFRGAYDDWTHVVPGPGDEPRPSSSSVFPRVGRFTRVCAYDRPGTVDFSGVITPSTPVRQPTTAADDVADLHALLNAASVPGPYVLVAHSLGGMIAYLYASEYPGETAGLVLLDPGSVYLKTALKPGQWARFVRRGRMLGKPRTLEAADYERSVDAALAAPAVPRVPSVVLTSDHRFDFGAGPGTWRAWRVAQNRLATNLGARHIADTNSGHYIAGERPRLVIGQVRGIVGAARAGTP